MVPAIAMNSLCFDACITETPTCRTAHRPQELKDTENLGPENWFGMTKQLTLEGVRPLLDPSHVGRGMMELIRDCWHGNPKNRPSMSTIVNRLDSIQSEFQ